MAPCQPVRREDRLIVALGSETLFLDLPRGVVRDVHRRIAAGAGKIGHGDAVERLVAGDTRIFAGAAGDDMRAAVQLGLRLVEVAGIEGREDLVAIGIGQNAGAVEIFLGP